MQDRADDVLGWNGDPLWYKDAIVYELHVRAFYDSDGDGIGDFHGLTEKLDYLQDLGVTAIWLLPFYPSPLKDDGYDIADYTSVHPSYGTLHDFRMFLREASRRGLRVITELVINHTSDQHPWFQRARRSSAGTRWRDFYVWSDSPDRYRDARIIFKDFESSNWTWDPVARAYYWHRFYHHQPDLNYSSPHVLRAMLRVMDFWLGMGVSGLRLDAVPYLYERESTICENLAETHQVLRELRRHLDERFRDRMLLAEANQWPEEAVAYFGNGDECHMAFHFPLMPRMFMGLRMEDRFPIVDILQQTPPIPANCQWALFLRNHDELTLEMVTDEERDYMYRIYAHDSHARINLGIRRRLAPLLNNDRKKIELMNGLLFSLPGTPVVYYGDEIGMGDNFYLGDRNGVRTPMQWSADRNAGFSHANPQKLYLPVIIDPEYHYEAINVEAQQNNPDSLLWWMKRLIALRKRSRAFGRGTIEFLNPENSKVLAFVRRYQDETVLVVANLSRLAQHAYLDLSRFEGCVPTELFGGTDFPVIGSAPYFLTLGPYGFYWFALQPQRAIPGQPGAPPQGAIATLSLPAERQDLLSKETRPVTEGVLLSYIRGRRWFGGKARRIHGGEILDVLPLAHNGVHAYFVLMRIEYAEGELETYVLPLGVAPLSKARSLLEESAQSAICRMMVVGTEGESESVLYDALSDREFCMALVEAISRRRHFKGENGELQAWHIRGALRKLVGDGRPALTPSLLKAEQSNTSVVYGDKLILKLFRRLGEGINPELEIGRFLTEKTTFTNFSPLAGAIEYQQERNGEPITLAVLQGYVQNQGDAWQYTLDSLGRFFERVLARPGAEAPRLPSGHILDLRLSDFLPLAEDTIGPYLASARLLGERTAQLHLALASDTEDPRFAPEPFTDFYRRSLFQSMRSLTRQTFETLQRKRDSLPEAARPEAERVLAMHGDILQRFHSVLEHRITATRIRCHGDYHLGQVLYTGNDFVIIDFEGEPARPLSERKLKRSPLRDVAGMVRSFHYAAHAAIMGQAPTVIRPEDLRRLEGWVPFWYMGVTSAFLRAYMQVASGASFLPANEDEVKLLLDAYLLEKAVYEVGYELNNRPAWVRVPLQGIIGLMEARG